jgi:tail tubular protein B|nr:MAG TPA: stabilization protein [Caudoviricetes sp.]
MPRITQSIKHFNAGISKQPPQLRQPEQLDEQINCFSSETDGLIKRAPLIDLAGEIEKGEGQEPFFHLLSRGDGEQHTLIADKDALRIYALDTGSNNAALHAATFPYDKYPYLRTDNPRQDLRMITIADHTFILNRRIPVKMKPAEKEHAWTHQGLLVHILSGHYGHTYSIELKGDPIGKGDTAEDDADDNKHDGTGFTHYGAKNIEIETLYEHSFTYISKHTYKENDDNVTETDLNNVSETLKARLKENGTWRYAVYGTRSTYGRLPMKGSVAIGMRELIRVRTWEDDPNKSTEEIMQYSAFVKRSKVECDLYNIETQHGMMSGHTLARHTACIRSNGIDHPESIYGDQQGWYISLREGTLGTPTDVLETDGGTTVRMKSTDIHARLTNDKNLRENNSAWTPPNVTPHKPKPPSQGQQYQTIRISHTTPDGGESKHAVDIGTDKIAAALAAEAKKKGYKVMQQGSWLYLTKDGMDLSKGWNVSDGYDNTAAIGIWKSVGKFSHLPTTAPDGFTVQIKGEPGSKADDYYVRYSASEHRWIETHMPGIATDIDASTMPILLKSLGNNKFALEKAEWDTRDIGDEESNPLPSFINKTLDDIFLFHNRLGVVSGEQVCMSESGSYFNYFMTTATEVVDTDPIDTPVSYPSIVRIEHAVIFQEALLLFSKTAQFILYASGALTPKNVNIRLLSEYSCDTTVRPTVAGERIYYTTRRGSYQIVRELYATGTIEDAKLTNDITAHIPTYLVAPLYSLWENTTENFLIFLSNTEQETVYLYKYLFMDGQRVQSAWSKWTFNGCHIEGAGFIGSILYILYHTSAERRIAAINTTARDKARVYLDRLKEIHVSEWQVKTGSDEELDIVDSRGAYIRVRADESLQPYITRKDITADGKLTVGKAYASTVTLSPIYIRDEQREMKAVTQGRLQLDHLNIEYTNTGMFDVHVSLRNHNDQVYHMIGKTVGTVTAANNKPLKIDPLHSGTYHIPLHSETGSTRIRIESKNPYPMNIIAASWEGRYYAPMHRV